MSSRTLVLIGLMGSGKSTLGRALAELEDVPFFDLDRLVEQAVGHSVRQIFKRYGEEAFRAHEHRALCELQSHHAVLATGGGAPMNPANWPEMRRLGPICWLRVKPDRISERLVRTRHKRPMLTGDDWKERLTDLYDEREPIYSQADVIIDVPEGDVHEVAKEIRGQIPWP